MTMRRRGLLVIPALLALAFTAVLAGPVLAGPVQAAQPPSLAAAAAVDDEEPDEAIDEPGNGVLQCNGGAQEAALVRMNDLPTNLAENGVFVPLPGANISFVTPANDSDQILVTFSAEARLLGQPVNYNAPVDALQIRVLLDGVPMNPLNDLTFTTDAGQSNATQACHRPAVDDAAVAHIVRVEWLLVDQDANNNVLTGTLDDWLLHVEINN